MKKQYTALLFLALSVLTFAQDRNGFDTEFNTVRSELTNWDPVRGEWLASSFEAMSFGEAIPDRTFPEDFTPYQVFSMVPENVRATIIQQTNQNRPSSSYPRQWNSIRRFVSATECSTIKGRSYGDPHLISFDGARFSFQTVGEFVMAKSNILNFEVQVRQRQQSDDFSLNSAVAMNVNGDRLCIYADDYPDADYSTPVRLNGMSVHLTNATFFLPHGGTIRKSGQMYTVYFPNGEIVTAKIRNANRRGFMDVSVIVLPCSANDINGLLGNANGTTRDDFDIPGRNNSMVYSSNSNDNDYFKRERQAFLAKDFAEIHRVTMATTLFDYPPGMSTASYTNRMYPIVHRNLNDVNPRQVERARRLCQERGVNPLDMNGCIFDNTYMNIPPSNEPIVRDPTNGTVFRDIVEAKPNVNPVGPSRPKPSPKPVIEQKDPGSNNNGSQSIPTNSGSSTKPVYKPAPKPVYKPKPTTKPAYKPKPVYKPKPTTKPVYKPKPKPVAKPKPKPLPSGRKG